MEVYIMYGVTYMEVLRLYGDSGLLSITIAVYLWPYKCGTFDVVCVWVQYSLHTYGRR